MLMHQTQRKIKKFLKLLPLKKHKLMELKPRLLPVKPHQKRLRKLHQLLLRKKQRPQLLPLLLVECQMRHSKIATNAVIHIAHQERWKISELIKMLIAQRVKSNNNLLVNLKSQRK